MRVTEDIVAIVGVREKTPRRRSPLGSIISNRDPDKQTLAILGTGFYSEPEYSYPAWWIL
jgi:hypothetical protein